MGKRRDPIPVKLFIGLLTSDRELLQECEEALTNHFGPSDLESSVLPWDHTDYYLDEMGPSLVRKFIFFKRLLDPSALNEVKVFTVSLEDVYGQRTGQGIIRRVNLDPGYVTEAKVVLATTKDFSHRIYLGRGIYGEVTLYYERHDRAYHALAHTYPEFRSPASLALFKTARDMLRKQLHRQVK